MIVQIFDLSNKKEFFENYLIKIISQTTANDSNDTILSFAQTSPSIENLF